MRPLLSHLDKVYCLAYLDGGRLLVSGGADRLVKFWDVFRETAQTVYRAGGAIVACRATDDGRTLAWASTDSVVLWDVATGKYKHLWKSSGLRTQLTLSLHSRTLGAATLEQRDGRLQPNGVQFWDVPSQAWCQSPLPAAPEDVRQRLTQGVWAMAFAPSHDLLALGLGSGNIHLLAWPHGSAEAVLAQPVPARSLEFDPDSSRLAVVGRGQYLALWNLGPSHRCLRLGGHTSFPQCVAFSPDGRTLASGGLDGLVILWDAGSGVEKVRFDWQIGEVHALAFAPDGMTLAVGGEKGIMVFDLDD
jgi:WD40 repeat protein